MVVEVQGTGICGPVVGTFLDAYRHRRHHKALIAWVNGLDAKVPPVYGRFSFTDPWSSAKADASAIGRGVGVRFVNDARLKPWTLPLYAVIRSDQQLSWSAESVREMAPAFHVIAPAVTGLLNHSYYAWLGMRICVVQVRPIAPSPLDEEWPACDPAIPLDKPQDSESHRYIFL